MIITSIMVATIMTNTDSLRPFTTVLMAVCVLVVSHQIWVTVVQWWRLSFVISLLPLAIVPTVVIVVGAMNVVGVLGVASDIHSGSSSSSSSISTSSRYLPPLLYPLSHYHRPLREGPADNQDGDDESVIMQRCNGGDDHNEHHGNHHPQRYSPCLFITVLMVDSNLLAVSTSNQRHHHTWWWFPLLPSSTYTHLSVVVSSDGSCR